MRENKEELIDRIHMVSFLVILAFFIVATIVNIAKINGTAKVINYAGIVRGGTQRLIKLEIAEQPDDSLISKMDVIMEGLEKGGTEYKLVKISDAEFRKQLHELFSEWIYVKNEIYRARKDGWQNTNIIFLSERYFNQANLLVFAAESYSERLSRNLTISEAGMVSFIIFILIITAKKIISAILIKKQNLLLKKTIFIDKHTGLPNKNKCEDLLNNSGFLDKRTTCMMFDLNNLKKVNDSLGHIAGDSMIMNFAHIVRSAVPGNNFVGRYGGDEFLVILYNSDPDDGKKIAERAIELTEAFNKLNSGISLSFAAGYAHSSTLTQCTLKTLLEQADASMYQNKRAMKHLSESSI